MPIYAFEGRREQDGEVVTGMREAPSHAVLGQDLLIEGVLLTRFEERRQQLPGASIFAAVFGQVSVLERLLFARYFSLMLRAGLDVKRSLIALQEQSRSRPMKTALAHVLEGVERGQTLAESMASFGPAFPPLFISFVRVGETTGRLQESLGVLAEQLQKEFELRRAVRGAMLYPAVILVALFTVAAAMMVFVIPKLVEVFQGFNVQLPLTTRILIAVSSFFTVYWYLVIVAAGVLVVAGWLVWRVRSVHDTALHWLLYLPIVGPIMQRVNLARFTRNLSSLLSSGVSFVEALDTLGTNTPHPSYAKIFLAAKEHVKQGKVLSDFLQDFPRLFPPLVTNITKVGEETGELDTVLREIALFYESELDQTMKNLTSVLEPVLMVVIGIGVGALAISIISPIYNLVNVI